MAHIINEIEVPSKYYDQIYISIEWDGTIYPDVWQERIVELTKSGFENWSGVYDKGKELCALMIKLKS